uniref:Putative ribonuclease H-like domain-containing protein n=1 Tax=Tanacetum cinerariifolium TaxID=118510 RepID=A0A6L2KZN3_TANCI|nr:putative ribonuclease H-like domain-containing protein [Tanacetum cinerariifolium]
MYSFDLKNVVPSGGLTCLFSKAIIDDSNLWHRRLGHIHFKTMNKLVRRNLVIGLPSKIFENDHTCVACQKEKQHKASGKPKLVSSISQPLQMLHMDLFGPTFVKSLDNKMYCLVVTDDFSRFSWVFFLASKDETSGILKSFITGIENQINHRVKLIRRDNETKFKNSEMHQFCQMKGIKREFSVASTPQQNGVAERKNRTLIEAATMLAYSLLPTTFWAEAVNTACYVHNRVLAEEGFLVGYSVNITAGNQTNNDAGIEINVNTGKVGQEKASDHKFILLPFMHSNSPLFLSTQNSDDKDTDEVPGKGDEGVSKGSGIDDQERTDSNTQDVNTAELSINTASTNINIRSLNNNTVGHNDPSMPSLEETGMFDDIYDDREVDAEVDINNLELSTVRRTNHKDYQNYLFACFLSQQEPKKVIQALADPRWIEAMQEELLQFKLQKVWTLVDLPNGKRAIRTKWVFKNKKDEKGILVRNEARLVAQGYTQKEGIDYDEMDVKSAFLYGIIEEEVYVCQPLVLKIYIFLTSCTRKGTIDKTLFIKKDKDDILLVQVYVDDIIFGSTKKFLCDEFEQMMRKRFQMSSIRELTFFLGFQVKQKDDGYFINQDKYMADILKKFDFTTAKTASTPMEPNKALIKDAGKIDQTLFIKKQKGDILLVQVYVDGIIFGSTNKELCKAFEKLMKNKFQMSFMGEPTFFLGLQVKQKGDGIFISQDKYVAKILRKFSFTYVKSASTPIETEKRLLKDPDGEDVDVHIYMSMIGSLMYLTSSRPDIMFAVCACARFQVTLKVSHLNAVIRILRYLKGKPHLGLWYSRDSPFNLVAYSDSDYAGASLDRKFTTGGCQFLGCRLISLQCKKQTVVAISSTKAEYVAAASCCAQVLWIQNQLLDYGDCNDKKLIQVVKIPSDNNFVDLLTKAFDVGRFQYFVAINDVRHFITAVSYDLMLFGLTKDAVVQLMLLGHKLMLSMATDTVKKVNDDVQLRALIDGKKVVVSEAIIRRDLHLDDADGVECLPNEEIFERLARIGYEKPSPKLTFYKAFFSAQWKFLIHTLVQCLSAKRTAWNEFSCSIASAVICLATGVLNMRRVGKGFSGVDTPLFASMLVPPPPQAEDEVEIPVAPAQPSPTSAPSPSTLQDPTHTPHASPLLDQPTTSHESSIPLLTTLTETCEDASKQGGKIAAIDADEGITLVDVETDKEVVVMDAETQERLNQEDFSAAEPIVFDDEDVTMTMARTLIKLKAEKAKLLDEHIAQKLHDEEKSFKKLRTDEVSGSESTQENPSNDPKEMSEEDVQNMLEIVPVPEFKVEALQVKYPIIDWEIHTEGFDKKDLVALWKLVKEKFSSTVPSKDKEKALWVELKRLFEPDADDVLWKLQRYMHAPLTWKLYTKCGVHHVSSTRGHDIFMLTEKDYPLSNAVMILMLSEKLQVEEDNEMARDLVKKIFIEANKPKNKTKDNVVQRLKENAQRNYYCWFNITTAGSTLVLLDKVDAAAKVLKIYSKSLVLLE